MNSKALDELHEALKLSVKRYLTSEQGPECRDCIYREMFARPLPQGAIPIKAEAFAEWVAAQAVNIVRIIQSRK